MNHRREELEARLQHALCIENDCTASAHFLTTLEHAKVEQQKRMLMRSPDSFQNTFIMAKKSCGRYVILQAALLVLCMIVVLKLYGGRSINIYSLDTIIGTASILSLLSTVPYLKNSKKYQMLELEIASCTTPKALILARILPMLLSELGLLVGITLFAVMNFGVPTERVLLSALLPYLTVSTLSGLLLIWSEGEFLSEISLAVGAVVFCILLVRKEVFPISFLEDGIVPGFVICAMLVAVSLLQAKPLMKILYFQNEVI